MFVHALVLVGHAVVVGYGANNRPIHKLPDNWFSTRFYQVLVLSPNAIGKVGVAIQAIMYLY